MGTFRTIARIGMPSGSNCLINSVPFPPVAPVTKIIADLRERTLLAVVVEWVPLGAGIARL